MAEDVPKYYAVLTEAGAALEARALAEGRGVLLTTIAVGNANRKYVEPTGAETELVNEVWRKAIDSKSQSPEDPAITLLHAVIPATEGGFWIRELGVLARLEGEEEEILYAYASHAPYYKMLPQEGQTVTHEIIVPVTTSSDANVTIVVSEQGYATRCELEELAKAMPGIAAYVELAANLVAVSDRVTRIEAAAAEGQSLPSTSLPKINPAGISLGDAVAAPVTLVPEGGETPEGAAFVVKFEDLTQEA